MYCSLHIGNPAYQTAHTCVSRCWMGPYRSTKRPACLKKMSFIVVDENRHCTTLARSITPVPDMQAPCLFMWVPRLRASRGTHRKAKWEGRWPVVFETWWKAKISQTGAEWGHTSPRSSQYLIVLVEDAPMRVWLFSSELRVKDTANSWIERGEFEKNGFSRHFFVCPF